MDKLESVRVPQSLLTRTLVQKPCSRKDARNILSTGEPLTPRAVDTWLARLKQEPRKVSSDACPSDIEKELKGSKCDSGVRSRKACQTASRYTVPGALLAKVQFDNRQHTLQNKLEQMQVHAARRRQNLHERRQPQVLAEYCEQSVAFLGSTRLLRDRFGSRVTNSDKTSDLILEYRVSLHEQTHEFGADLSRQALVVRKEEPVVDEPVSPRVRLAAAEAIWYSNQLLKGQNDQHLDKDDVDEGHDTGPPTPASGDIRLAVAEALRVSELLLASSSGKTAEQNLQHAEEVISHTSASQGMGQVENEDDSPSVSQVENEDDSPGVSQVSSPKSVDIDHAAAEIRKLSSFSAPSADERAESQESEFQLISKTNATIQASEHLLTLANRSYKFFDIPKR